MKNTTLLLFTILFSLSTFAQDNFAPIGAKWYADFNTESHSGYTVYEVTKDFVTLKCGDKKYRVYTSSRKISSFKKSVLELRK